MPEQEQAALFPNTSVPDEFSAAEREKKRLEATGYRAPPGKPDKRARRLIQALGDLDALD